MQRIVSFDSLRFASAIYIVLCHITLPGPFFHTAYLAVEVFFVLSGFLLAKKYDEYKYRELSNFELCQQYFLGRFRRLWPEYLFAILLAWTMLNTFGHSNSANSQPLWLNLFMLAGWGGINNLQYGMWYIAVLLWGGSFLFNLLAFQKEKAKMLYLPCISILCLFYLTNRDGLLGHQQPVDFYLLSRGTVRGLLGLTVGIYTYWICDFLKEHKLPLKKEWTNKFLLLGEFVSVIALFYTFTFQIIENSSDFNIYFYISFLVGLLSFKRETLLKFLSWKFWAPFGKVSYMLYLTHFIVIDIFKTQWGEWGTQHLLLTYCIILPTAVVFAFFCYWEQKWLFEKLKRVFFNVKA